MSGVYEQLADFVASGGFVMPPLVLATLVLWWALGWRLMTLQRGARGSLRKLVRNGVDQPTGIVDTAIAKGRRIIEAGMSEPRRHLDQAFYEFEERLQKHSVLIRSIVIVAPLAGLLGTVGGMIETFDSLGDMSLFARSGGIAGGISQALVSTQMGLAVAVPGLVMGRILDRRAEVLSDELERVKELLSQ